MTAFLLKLIYLFVEILLEQFRLELVRVKLHTVITGQIFQL